MLEPTTFLVTAGKTKETGSHPDYSIQLNFCNCSPFHLIKNYLFSVNYELDSAWFYRDDI